MADLRPVDDLSIPGDERLYIRFFASPDSIRPVSDTESRPNSGALLPRRKDEPLSVDLGSLCAPEETRDRGGRGGPFHVAVVSVAEVRTLGLRVTRDPIAEGEEGGPNPAHALLHGTRDTDGDLRGGLRRSEAEKLARAARVCIRTPLPSDDPPIA